MFFCDVSHQKIAPFCKTFASNNVSLPECSPAATHTSDGCESKRMFLNNSPLGGSTPVPAWDPLLLHLTLHSIPSVTIFLTRNVWFQEAADILTPGNITIIFTARRSWVNESSF